MISLVSVLVKQIGLYISFVVFRTEAYPEKSYPVSRIKNSLKGVNFEIE
jgi:hypothetical protein